MKQCLLRLLWRQQRVVVRGENLLQFCVISNSRASQIGSLRGLSVCAGSRRRIGVVKIAASRNRAGWIAGNEEAHKHTPEVLSGGRSADIMKIISFNGGRGISTVTWITGECVPNGSFWVRPRVNREPECVC